jgi:hypothetical protein
MFENNFIFIMNMNNNSNIEKFLDDKISSGLLSKTSESFPDEVMKRIELSRKFATEDKKTSVFAYFLSASLALVTLVLLFEFVGSYFHRTEEGNFQFTVMLSNFFEKFSVLAGRLLEVFGITTTFGVLIFFISVPLVIFILVYLDKLVFKKKI